MSGQLSKPQQLYLREDIAAMWSAADVLDTAFALDGEVFRDVPGRRTLRVKIGDAFYFVKLHYGVGWGELFKNWLQLKRPVVGAENEYYACRELAKLGISAPLPAAFAQSSGPVAYRRSFVLCDELAGYTSLEDITEHWPQVPPTLTERRRLLKAVAQFAKTFHSHGFIHRDFYICHLLLNDTALAAGELELAVLDLHRARQFEHIPRRWLRRDLAALIFSCLDLGFSQRDWLRFIRIYTGEPLKAVFKRDARFWQTVWTRAEKLYDEGLRKGTVKGFHRS